jgi:hypothetical protein
VKGGLLLGGGKRPGGAGAALLAEHESKLLRRPQLRLVGTEGGTGLGQIESAEEVDAKEAFLAPDLLHGAFDRPLALRVLHLLFPQCRVSDRMGTWRIKAPFERRLKGSAGTTPQIAEKRISRRK